MTQSAKAYATLTATNFGPLGECKLDLRPLTIFTGPSNTGKSWCATLVYALLQRGISDSPWWPRFRLTQDFPELPDSFWESLQQVQVLQLPGSEIADSSYGENIRLALDRVLAEKGKEIERCFGISDPGQLVSETCRSGGMRITMQYPPSGENPEGWGYDLEAGDGWHCSVRLPEPWTIGHRDEALPVMTELMKNLESGDPPDEQRKRFLLHREFYWLFLHSLYRNTPRNAWYMPADRGGIMHAHRVVVGALIRDAARAGLAPQSPLAPLSGVLADFLGNLVRLADDPEEDVPFSHYMPDQSPRSEPADDLEGVLGGRVTVGETNVNYPRIVWQPRGWQHPLDLMHASSMVTELSPVVLYLRHFVRPGDLLILEEPEAHLHPARQVEIVEQAAQWVRDGVRVILTTHSEWVLEALSNLVGAAEKDEAAENDEKEGLPADYVGLWQFEAQKDGGSVVREISFDENEGGFDSGYDAVAADLHNHWADIVGGTE
ncbi:MAG: AAA family ATPase [Hyphomonadaceae bacterium]|nr:AAA family ATPase [Hyphomonadaceae bacterium]